MTEPDPASRRVRLFRDNGEQLVQIPKEFELPGSEAIISRAGDRLIIEPVRRRGLAALLDSWEPLAEEFPEIADPPPASPIEASRRFRQEITQPGPDAAKILREAREEGVRRTTP